LLRYNQNVGCKTCISEDSCRTPQTALPNPRDVIELRLRTTTQPTTSGFSPKTKLKTVFIIHMTDFGWKIQGY